MLYHLSLQSVANESTVEGLGCCADMLYHLNLQSLANGSMVQGLICCADTLYHLSLQSLAKELAEDREGGGHLHVDGPQPGPAQALHTSGYGGQVPHHHEAQHQAHPHLQCSSATTTFSSLPP